MKDTDLEWMWLPERSAGSKKSRELGVSDAGTVVVVGAVTNDIYTGSCCNDKRGPP